MMKDKINNLYNKDDNVSYNTLKELELIASQSNELYEYFDELLNMLNNEKSFIRVRGFRLICALAKWDTKGKTENNITPLKMALPRYLNPNEKTEKGIKYEFFGDLLIKKYIENEATMSLQDRLDQRRSDFTGIIFLHMQI